MKLKLINTEEGWVAFDMSMVAMQLPCLRQKKTFEFIKGYSSVVEAWLSLSHTNICSSGHATIYLRMKNYISHGVMLTFLLFRVTFVHSIRTGYLFNKSMTYSLQFYIWLFRNCCCYWTWVYTLYMIIVAEHRPIHDDWSLIWKHVLLFETYRTLALFVPLKGSFIRRMDAGLRSDDWRKEKRSERVNEHTTGIMEKSTRSITELSSPLVAACGCCTTTTFWNIKLSSSSVRIVPQEE